MSDAPPPPAALGAARPLSPADIDRILADFRGYLEGLTGQQPAHAGRPPEPVDLHTLVAAFTALRHDVNLQTKAARAAVELAAKSPAPPPAADNRQVAKAVLDIADALALSLRQVEKVRDAPRAGPPKPGFLARLFAPPPADDPGSILSGIADGYALSLRRVERLLPQLGLESIKTEGQPFDPDTMEVVEVVDGPAPGTVAEEVRRGYRMNGTVFRFAQVKVVR